MKTTPSMIAGTQTQNRQIGAGKPQSAMEAVAHKHNVSIIPATKRCVQSGNTFRTAQSFRVAAYCRVSTEEESQQNSYATQRDFYTNLIYSHPGWEMAGIYADEGKSGTSRKHRVQFNRMLDDARAGKIDYIITKSISRFARNTVDALDCVHELQRLRPPVGIYFERERIDTLNQNSEMFLTFYCSMAQEESRSISENIRWSIRRKMAAGEPLVNLRRMLGYDQCRDGAWKINEEQAMTVCYIYGRFLQGFSANRIARELNESGRSTVNGGIWRADTILGVLRNEKYVGDLLMQKTYTESFLTHKSVRNTGEVEQYFKANHHPAIINRESWDKTQELLKSRSYKEQKTFRIVKTESGNIMIGTGEEKQESRRGAAASAFNGLRCGDCGETYRRLTYHCAARNYTDERVNHPVRPGEENYEDSFDFAYGVWKCRGTARNAEKNAEKNAKKNAGRKQPCRSVALVEISMEQSFMEMLYRIKRDCELNGANAEIIQSFQGIYASVSRREVNSGFIEQKLELLQLELEKLDAAYRDACRKRETAAYAERIHIGNLAGEGLLSLSGDMTLPGGAVQYERLAEDLKKRMEEKREEYQKLFAERGVASKMKLNFESFLKALEALPDTNAAGAKMNVNTLDVNGSIFRTAGGQQRNWNKSQYNRGKLKLSEELLADAPDYLHFDEYYLRTFFLGMTVYGDEIHYITTFGLSLTSIGNTRGIKSFIGFRLSDEDGTMRMVMEAHQIAKGSIQHHWRRRMDWNRIKRRSDDMQTTE